MKQFSFLVLFINLLSFPLMAQNASITFQVDMTNENVSGNVGVSGSFNGFAFLPMVNLGSDIYEVTVDLLPGSSIEYKFRNGEAYENPPAACGTGDFGNRELLVPQESVILDLVCYATCAVCAVIEEYTLTFRVNASQIFDFDQNGVHIAGNFNNYTPQPMTNVGILNYTFTAQIEAGTTVLFKFLNGNSFDGAESVPGICGVDDGFGGFNRSFEMPAEDVVLDNVCFAACEPCGALSFYSVTLRVDASQVEEIHPEGIFIGGNFSEFIPEAMIDQGNGIYEHTINAPAGQPLRWKYLNGPTYNEQESVPSACGIDDGLGGLNRLFIVPAEDAVLNLVCFSSCSTCVNPDDLYNLVFQVDASELGTIDPAGIFIAGSFNGFTPVNMTDAGNDIYTFSAVIETGTTVLWKYLNGASFDNDEDVPAACGESDGFGGFNRILEMPSSNTILPLTCFSSCGACIISSTENTFTNRLELFPNPNRGDFNILSPLSGNGQLSLYDLSGRLIFATQVSARSGENIPLETGILNSGIYIVVFDLNESRFTAKMTVL